MRSFFPLPEPYRLYLGYRYAMAPLRQVKFLRDHNPTETSYMTRYRATFEPQ